MSKIQKTNSKLRENASNNIIMRSNINILQSLWDYGVDAKRAGNSKAGKIFSSKSPQDKPDFN